MISPFRVCLNMRTKPGLLSGPSYTIDTATTIEASGKKIIDSLVTALAGHMNTKMDAFALGPQCHFLTCLGQEACTTSGCTLSSCFGMGLCCVLCHIVAASAPDAETTIVRVNRRRLGGGNTACSKDKRIAVVIAVAQWSFKASLCGLRCVEGS
jgi:hypothetical protein